MRLCTRQWLYRGFGVYCRCPIISQWSFTGQFHFERLGRYPCSLIVPLSHPSVDRRNALIVTVTVYDQDAEREGVGTGGDRPLLNDLSTGTSACTPRWYGLGIEMSRVRNSLVSSSCGPVRWECSLSRALTTVGQEGAPHSTQM